MDDSASIQPLTYGRHEVGTLDLPDYLRFLLALFGLDETVLFRPIETWTEGGKKQSRVIYKQVKYRTSFPALLMTAMNKQLEVSSAEKANVFFGVCPRFGSDGKYDLAWQIRQVNCLWADIDHATVEEVLQRCRDANLPEPSIVVSSGNGVHLYWLLKEPYRITDAGEPQPVVTDWSRKDDKGRPFKYFVDEQGKVVSTDSKRQQPKLSPQAQLIQDIVGGIATKIGGDHTMDLTRLLRVPGTMNRKDERNGKDPVPCTLVTCDPDRRFAIDEFHHFAELSPEVAHRAALAKVPLPRPRKPTQGKLDRFDEWIARSALAEPGNRSSVDFGLCCFAIRGGIAKEEVWGRVHDVGKFQEGGERYFERTWQQAEDEVRARKLEKLQAANDKPSRPSTRHKPRAGTDESIPHTPEPPDGSQVVGDDDDEAAPLTESKGRTEIANAKRFRRWYGSRIRFCDPQMKWYLYDGRRWSFDQRLEIEALGKTVPEWIWRQYEEMKQDADEQLRTAADKEERAAAEAYSAIVDDIRQFARSSSCVNSIKHFLELARSEPGIPILPEVFDQYPYLFNVANGTIDLRNGELRPHQREDNLTKLCPIAFDASAPAPTWLQFLDDVFAKNEELIQFIKRAAGYSLTALTNERCLFFLYGKGKNGKTTFVSTLQKVMGDYAGQITTELLMAAKGERHPTEICDLAGKRLAVASETEDGRRFAESFVKSMTGGEDVMKGRRMREDMWEFRATHKLWISGNHKPRIQGTDDGIWDRLRLIPFNVRFDKPDRTLPAKLTEELPGILAWMVEGCLEWQQYGLQEPEVVKQATSAYRSESDLVGEFVRECCIEHEMFVTSSAALYESFSKWSGSKAPLSRPEFGAALAERGYLNRKITSGPEKGNKCWCGIGLIAEHRDAA